MSRSFNLPDGVELGGLPRSAVAAALQGDVLLQALRANPTAGAQIQSRVAEILEGLLRAQSVTHVNESRSFRKEEGRLDEARAALRSATNESRRTARANADLEQKAAELQQSVARGEMQGQQLAHENARLRAQVGELHAAEGEGARVEDELRAAEDHLRASLASHEELKRKWHAEIRSVEAQLKQAEQQYELQLQDKDADASELSQAAARLEAQLADAHAACDEAVEAGERRIAEQKKKRRVATAELERAEALLAKSEGQRLEMRSKYLALAQRVEQLAAEETKHKSVEKTMLASQAEMVFVKKHAGEMELRVQQAEHELAALERQHKQLGEEATQTRSQLEILTRTTEIKSAQDDGNKNEMAGKLQEATLEVDKLTKALAGQESDLAKELKNELRHARNDAERTQAEQARTLERAIEQHRNELEQVRSHMADEARRELEEHRREFERDRDTIIASKVQEAEHRMRVEQEAAIGKAEMDAEAKSTAAEAAAATRLQESLFATRMDEIKALQEQMMKSNRQAGLSGFLSGAATGDEDVGGGDQAGWSFERRLQFVVDSRLKEAKAQVEAQVAPLERHNEELERRIRAESDRHEQQTRETEARVAAEASVSAEQQRREAEEGLRLQLVEVKNEVVRCKAETGTEVARLHESESLCEELKRARDECIERVASLSEELKEGRSSIALLSRSEASLQAEKGRSEVAQEEMQVAARQLRESLAAEQASVAKLESIIDQEREAWRSRLQEALNRMELQEDRLAAATSAAEDAAALEAALREKTEMLASLENDKFKLVQSLDNAMVALKEQAESMEANKEDHLEQQSREHEQSIRISTESTARDLAEMSGHIESETQSHQLECDNLKLRFEMELAQLKKERKQELAQVVKEKDAALVEANRVEKEETERLRQSHKETIVALQSEHQRHADDHFVVVGDHKDAHQQRSDVHEQTKAEHERNMGETITQHEREVASQQSEMAVAAAKAEAAIEALKSDVQHEAEARQSAEQTVLAMEREKSSLSVELTECKHKIEDLDRRVVQGEQSHEQTRSAHTERQLQNGAALEQTKVSHATKLRRQRENFRTQLFSLHQQVEAMRGENMSLRSSVASQMQMAQAEVLRGIGDVQWRAKEGMSRTQTDAQVSMSNSKTDFESRLLETKSAERALHEEHAARLTEQHQHELTSALAESSRVAVAHLGDVKSTAERDAQAAKLERDALGRERDKLRGSVRSLEESVRALEQKVAAEQKAMSEMSRTLERSSGKVSEQHTQLAVYEQDLASSHVLIDTMESDKMGLTQQHSAMTEQNQQLQGDVSSLQVAISNAKALLRTVSSEIPMTLDLHAALSVSPLENDMLTQALHQLDEAIVKVKASCEQRGVDSMKPEAERLQLLVAEGAERSNALKVELAEAQTMCSGMSDRIAELQHVVEMTHADLQQARSDGQSKLAEQQQRSRAEIERTKNEAQLLAEMARLEAVTPYKNQLDTLSSQVHELEQRHQGEIRQKDDEAREMVESQLNVSAMDHESKIRDVQDEYEQQLSSMQNESIANQSALQNEVSMLREESEKRMAELNAELSRSNAELGRIRSNMEQEDAQFAKKSEEGRVQLLSAQAEIESRRMELKDVKSTSETEKLHLQRMLAAQEQTMRSQDRRRHEMEERERELSDRVSRREREINSLQSQFDASLDSSTVSVAEQELTTRLQVLNQKLTQAISHPPGGRT